MAAIVLKTHNIVFGTMSGERADVDNTVVDDWVKKLPEICTGYSPEDIFNMDKTGLFLDRPGLRPSM